MSIAPRAGNRPRRCCRIRAARPATFGAPIRMRADLMQPRAASIVVGNSATTYAIGNRVCDVFFRGIVAGWRGIVMMGQGHDLAHVGRGVGLLIGKAFCKPFELGIGHAGALPR